MIFFEDVRHIVTATVYSRLLLVARKHTIPHTIIRKKIEIFIFFSLKLLLGSKKKLFSCDIDRSVWQNVPILRKLCISSL